jgi:DNA-binding NarL/FixJ family response regulator
VILQANLLDKHPTGIQSMPQTILVVDDDLGTRLSISDYLELSGYTVVTADDGQQALALVHEYRPDLIVTDIMMPRLNGYELVRRVRQDPELRLMPVILLTARTKTQERILGYQSGCDLYLPKPFELEELAAAINSILARSRFLRSDYILTPRENKEGFSSFEDEDDSGLQKPKYHEIDNSQLPFPLTGREQQVLELLTHGFSNMEMGQKLHLSARTVEKYVSSLLRKTATNNRAELVRFALKHGLVD